MVLKVSSQGSFRFFNELATARVNAHCPSLGKWAFCFYGQWLERVATTARAGRKSQVRQRASGVRKGP